ncbi:hypothetical protein [Corallococcus sp. 4LFB]|uniref:hypothetical protein n=1 Tax=Corallococcus sp. 4LFB TaxID=3383249 RepID=UPI003975D657
MSFLSRLTTLALVCLVSSSAMAAYSPSSPPDGWVGTPEAWGKLLKQAEAQAADAAKLSKGANANCLTGVFMKLLLAAQIAISTDRDGHGLTRNIDKDKARSVRARAQSERDDACNGPGGGGATVEAMARYVEDHAEDYNVADLRSEMASLYSSAKGRATPSTPWVEYLIKAGFLVQQAGSRVAVAAGSLLPIVDPEMFNRKGNPQDGI